VVQESLTNALKHAPGAPVDVVIAGTGGGLEISVANGVPTAPLSGLEQAGGGRGLAGMRERVHACGGELTAGMTADGGWRVLARFPRGMDAAHPAADGRRLSYDKDRPAGCGDERGTAPAGLVMPARTRRRVTAPRSLDR
jgi:Histidine kinase-, DNA gyrase B-, and HSP90-like ATPase